MESKYPRTIVGEDLCSSVEWKKENKQGKTLGGLLKGAVWGGIPYKPGNSRLVGNNNNVRYSSLSTCSENWTLSQSIKNEANRWSKAEQKKKKKERERGSEGRLWYW